MSDIEVLRKLTKIFNELKKDDEEGHSSAYELQWEDIQAIENLIIENKELKEENNKLKTCDGIFDVFRAGKESSRQRIEFDYIPKTKVKEKIEELDKEMAKDEVDEFGIHSQGWAALDWTRDFLLKLLEEGE